MYFFICSWGDIAAEDSENKRKGLVPGTLKFCSISLSEAIDLKRVDIVSGNILKLGSRPTYFRPEEHILLVAEGGNVEVMINYMVTLL